MGAEGMDKEMGIMILFCICVIVLFIVILKKRAKFFLNFFIRMVVGAIAFVVVNDFFEKQGVNVYVGLNLCTLLTAGTLGFPGVALLYGIIVTKFL